MQQKLSSRHKSVLSLCAIKQHIIISSNEQKVGCPVIYTGTIRYSIHKNCNNTRHNKADLSIAMVCFLHKLLVMIKEMVTFWV